MSEKEDGTKLAPVVAGDTKAKKKNWLEKTGEAVFAQRDADTVKAYLFTDIIIPACKKLIYEIITSAADLMLYGGSTPSMNRGKTNSYYNYSSQYKNNPQPAKQNTVSGTDIFSFERIMFSSRADAEAVLDSMFDILDRYHLVTVAQFYDLSNYVTDNIQATKWGWLNLEGAEVVRDFSGDYSIRLAKPYPID